MTPPRLPSALAEVCNGWASLPVPDGEAGASVLRLSAANGQVRYLKYGAGPVADDISDEAARLVWLSPRMPCARLVQFVREPDTAWLLTDAVPGRTGDAWLADVPGAWSRFVIGAARLLRELHGLPVDDCPFDASARVRLATARRNVAAGIVDCDDFDDDHAGWTAHEILAEALRTLPAASGRVVTHGDYSLGNILFDQAGDPTGLIDVGRLGVADPYQDYAIFWQNLAEIDPAAQDLWLAVCGIDAVDAGRLHFHRLLDELF